MNAFLCPVCGAPLTGSEKQYHCPGGHSFDRAKSGYVNLLLRTGSGKRHGDDKAMVQARSAFLDKGWYDPLSRALAACALAHTGQYICLLDAGCGEGKYTEDIRLALQAAGKTVDAMGIDISKDALAKAGKRSRALRLAVASSAALPVAEGSVDLLLNIFSPLMAAEFSRVLSPGGILLRAFPLENHLWELKQQIYDAPYRNKPPIMETPGFQLLERRDICYRLRLTDPADIACLFRMTPYYYKTGLTDQEKLHRLTELNTAVEFGVGVYRKK